MRTFIILLTILSIVVIIIFVRMSTRFQEYPLETETPIYNYQIINVYPHDPTAFTQGLSYHNGVFYEGTGKHGHSSLRKVELETGKVLQIHHLHQRYYGEGITLWQDKIIQITWRSSIGFVYNRQNFEPLGSFTYPTRGWGITHDGQKLIMSDGTDKLYFLNVENYERIGYIQVRDQNKPVVRLNELEYVNGEIFANVWMSNYIVRISPQTGNVLGWINLTGLLGWFDRMGLKPLLFGNRRPNVLNGIAYDADGQRLFVTGKWWPKLFEIKLVPAKIPKPPGNHKGLPQHR